MNTQRVYHIKCVSMIKNLQELEFTETLSHEKLQTREELNLVEASRDNVIDSSDIIQLFNKGMVEPSQDVLDYIMKNIEKS